MRIYLTETFKFKTGTSPLVEKSLFGSDCSMSLKDFVCYFSVKVLPNLFGLIKHKNRVFYDNYYKSISISIKVVF